jgi:urea transport system ATP-binding protein
VIIVEHDMEFMRRYADSVTVLHAGAVLSEGSVAQVQADPAVQEVYLGRASAGDAGEAELQAEVLAAEGFTIDAEPSDAVERTTEGSLR